MIDKNIKLIRHSKVSYTELFSDKKKYEIALDG